MNEHVVPPWSTLMEQREALRFEDLIRKLTQSPGAKMVVLFCSECSNPENLDQEVAEIRASSAGPLFTARNELGGMVSLFAKEKDLTDRRVQAPWSEVNILLEIDAAKRPKRANGAPRSAIAYCPRHGTFDLDEQKLMKQVARYERTGIRVRVQAQRLCVVVR